LICPITTDIDIDFGVEGRGEVVKYIVEKYGKEHVEKFDLLGLKTLDVINHTQKLIRNKGGAYANFYISDIPEDDPATFKFFTEGYTENVFQFESDGIKYFLKQLKPDKIEELIALNAMYRPGLMPDILQYIDVKNGKRDINYLDPCLEDILKETYGIIVYQEQIMRIASRIAGYTLVEADNFRRKLSRGNKVEIDQEKKLFLENAAKQSFYAEKAGVIFDMLISFAGHTFNKSHAAAYAMIAYQTAYLKANFPEEFAEACTCIRTLQNDI